MRTPDHADDRTGRGHTAAFGVEPKTPAVCPDAAELAAWIDGASATGGRAEWDGHIAQCARCQQVAAAFATADPPDIAVQPQPLPAHQQTRFWLFRWNWALSAAAVVVVAAFGWVVVRPVVFETTQKPGTSSSLDAQMAAKAEPPDPGAGLPVQGQAEKGLSVPGEESAARAAETVAGAGAPAAATKTAGGTPGSGRATPPDAPPDPAAAAGQRRPTELARAQPGLVAQPGAVALAGAPPAAAPPSAERERALAARAAAAETPAQARAEDPAAAPRPAVQRVGLAEEAAFARHREGEVLVVAAGSPAVRWRARPGGVFETSVDEGRTWSRLDLSESRQVVAGSAPSPSVCWFVGRRGLVVRVGPGVSPDVAPFPEVVDLVDVEATSALAATVIAADGRSFFTSDGGVTWRR